MLSSPVLPAMAQPMGRSFHPAGFTLVQSATLFDVAVCLDATDFECGGTVQLVRTPAVTQEAAGSNPVAPATFPQTAVCITNCRGTSRLECRSDYLLLEPIETLGSLPLVAPRRGRRTALTFPVFPPPQKNWSEPSDSSPETLTPGGISRLSRTAPV